MGLRKYTLDIVNLLSNDETLLRLLYYYPKNALDDPLDSNKQNILDMDIDTRTAIIDNRIVTAPKFDDLDNEDNPICRLLVYPGIGRSYSNDYMVANQEYNFEVYVHFDYENADRRMEWICDRINELLFDNWITGMGKVYFKTRRPKPAPANYIGHQLIYEFGSVN